MGLLLDRQRMFQNVPWRQGSLNVSDEVRSAMPAEALEAAALVESCIAYTCCGVCASSGLSVGVVKQFVYHFNTPLECAAAVAAHNAKLLEAANGI